MADTKYSALPVATSVSPADLTCVVQGGVSKQASVGLVAKASAYSNASTATQTQNGTTELYLAGSGITVPAGIWTAGTNYWCAWDMSKSAAGLANLLLNIRIGTLGTTGDTAVLAYNSGIAQTAAADQGRFEVMLNVRSIATPTAATIICVVNILRLTATAAGFAAAATPNIVSVGTATTTFNATTATKIGVGVIGGTSFVGTIQLVQSELRIP